VKTTVLQNSAAGDLHVQISQKADEACSTSGAAPGAHMRRPSVLDVRVSCVHSHVNATLLVWCAEHVTILMSMASACSLRRR
jgi:hypothetical protein